MKDLGQEALEEMNRLLLNQERLKMKLEKMGNYGESATIKNQLADLSKNVARLQAQLRIATKALKNANKFPSTISLKEYCEQALKEMEGVK